MAKHNQTFVGLLATVAIGAVIAPQAAFARGKTDITPYIAVDQGVSANLKGGTGDDVVTYTTVTAGVDGNYQSRRLEAGISFQYSRQFNWDKNIADADIYSGLARARYGVTRDVNIEGGVMATRVRSGNLTGANGTIIGGGGSQVYSAYVGPTVTTHVGDLSVNGAYRFGYNKLESNNGVPASADRFDSSTAHFATASVGMQPGDLPIGWAVGGAWTREDANELDHRYEGKNVRLDITVPVSQTLAIIGGVGYEAIKISQRDAVRDASGNGVIGADGRFVTDKASPRLLAYDQKGIIYDAGVMWRPSRRTSASAYVGWRYDSVNYGGSFSWNPNDRTSLNIGVFNQIDSFGRQINNDIASLPTNFVANRNPFSGDLTGCATGTTGGGICLNNALTSLGAGNFRSRGVSLLYATMLGQWSYAVGGGYAERKFIAAAGTVSAINNGRSDTNWYANMSLGRPLGPDTTFSSNFYVNRFDAGTIGGIDVTNVGTNASVDHNFWRGLSGSVALGLDSIRPAGQDDILAGLAQVGMRYSF